MCKCGCNTCETKTQGPLLTEGKVKSLLSEGLQYHIDKKIPLFETVYRIGSEKHLALIKEARKMYSRNVIDLCEEDEALIKTHLGEFGLYEGESVPLDLPMLNEEKKLTYNDFIRMVRDDMMAGAAPDEYPSDEKVKKTAKAYYNQYLQGASVDDLFEAQFHIPSQEEVNKFFSDTQQEIHYLNSKPVKDWDEYDLSNWKAKLRKKEIGRPQFGESIDEAEFRGKDVPLNKPKRGGSKAYYVYVRDPKTKKIKKVSFGSGGLRAKIKNKEARNAFAKRHRCKDKKDRTKAGYWSCNLPRYASALGLGANMNTFW